MVYDKFHMYLKDSIGKTCDVETIYIYIRNAFNFKSFSLEYMNAKLD